MSESISAMSDSVHALSISDSSIILRPPICAVLCVSKDRAWQCGEFLRSLEYSQSQIEKEKQVKFSISVIFAASSDAHAQSYEKLIERYPDVHFQLETAPVPDTHLSTKSSAAPSSDPSSDATTTAASTTASSSSSSSSSSTTSAANSSTPFIDHVFACLSKWQSLKASDGTPLIHHIMLAVDDMLFYDPHVPYGSFLSYLSSPHQSQVFAVHLALHPQVSYCHPANKTATRPMALFSIQPGATAPLMINQLPADSPVTAYRYMRLMGSHDWQYPFSLCGSIYRIEDVQSLLHQCEYLLDRSAINHPNSLEVVGNQVVSFGMKALKGAAKPAMEQPPAGAKFNFHVPLATQRPMSCCISSPIMSVVTVNRVQDIFANPVYASAAPSDAQAEGASQPPSELDLSADGLLELSLKHPAMQYDLERYRKAAPTFNSVHVGEFLVQRTT